jgi:hypothetical protein
MIRASRTLDGAGRLVVGLAPMGFFDKIRGAVHAVTGGAATVTIEFQPATAFPGESVSVRVTATAKANPIKGDGIFVDIRGVEEIRVRKGESEVLTADLEINRTSLEQSFQISGPFEVGANAMAQWEGTIQIPGHAEPSFDGAICDHGWGIRGRLSMFGNDPDSGFVTFRVGKK